MFKISCSERKTARKENVTQTSQVSLKYFASLAAVHVTFIRENLNERLIDQME